jgi:hypothetical protein
MSALSTSLAEPSQQESVRRFFATLNLRARPDVWAQGWSQLPVEGFFVALRSPQRSINVDRRPCSEAVESLADLFGSVRWA